MYCPKCGQQQVSEEMRFCSKCGFGLSGLPEWLARGGVHAGGVPAKRETEVHPLSARRKGIRRAAKLMFLSGVLFPIYLAASLAIDEGAPMILPVMLFFISLVWMLYARLFSDKNAPVKSQAQTPNLGPTSARDALPPPTNMPIPNLGRQQVKTNELAQPPSVTENTTRLLDNE